MIWAKHALRNTYRRSVRRLLNPHFSLGNERKIDRCAFFFGDIPQNHRTFAIGPTFAPIETEIDAKSRQAEVENFVCVESYNGDRPEVCYYDDVLYSKNGYALHDGRIDYSISARKKHYNRDFTGLFLRRSGMELETATLIESHFPNTYGDWVFEILRSVTKNLPLNAPLLLPSDIASHGYVQTELDKVGVKFLVATSNVKIGRATVLHKPRCLNYWSANDVKNYRAAFGIEEIAPQPGSLVYLSRAGVAGTHGYVTRDYKSAENAKIIQDMGGRVIHTERMSMDHFKQLAPIAETVVADHGAALFNILQWRPKRVIEIVTNNWWDSSTLFVSRALGVQMHALIVRDDINVATLRQRLRGFLDHEI